MGRGLHIQAQDARRKVQLRTGSRPMPDREGAAGLEPTTYDRAPPVDNFPFNRHSNTSGVSTIEPIDPSPHEEDQVPCC